MASEASDRPAVFSPEWRADPAPQAPKTPPALGLRHRVARLNWPLWIGGLIVLLILLIAIAGPTLAPQDPMEEHSIIRVGDAWEIPPFPAFSVPGFPLGSDQFGRDLLSRLLWAVRPTLIMVATVAVVRLVLGIAIGLSAGWFTGQLGRGLDALINFALSVPVLMVALAAIAAVGVELGLPAFIIGLSLNGWVETARLVREQSKLVKGNLYVEAARALGASDSHILLRHVLRQIMPMAWMLFSFEISSTLMTTAGLGFLGYYIGGEVWVDVSDFVARRLSGTPELGQMLASAWSEQQVITEPWGMIVAGSVIFVAILGFNLLGEGLRLRLRLDQVQRRSTLSTVTRRIGEWVQERDDQARGPGLWEKVRPLRPILLVALVLTIGGGLLWARARSTTDSSVATANAPVQSQHLWAAERHDPQGTLWTPAVGPADPEVQWIFQDRTGFAGGPAVAADGTVYVASNGGVLYALDPQGNIVWQASLTPAAAAVGTPALDGARQIYVTDAAGGLSAFTPQGDRSWHFQPENGTQATTGPIAGPDGTLFYPAGSSLYAVSPDGEPLWTARVSYGFEPRPPHLDATGELVFFLNGAYHARDGSPQALEGLSGQLRNEQSITGADGQAYYRAGPKILLWHFSPEGESGQKEGRVEVIRSLNKQIPGIIKDAGVTRQGTVWGFSSTGYNSPESSVVWFDLQDQVLGNIEYLQAQSRVLAVDRDATLYSCGNTRSGRLDCVAVAPGEQDPLWRLPLEQGTKVIGGALVPERLYVTTAEGFLYALGPAADDAPPRVIDAQIPTRPAETVVPTKPSADD